MKDKLSMVMHEWKQGKLRSSSGQRVTSQKQAVAIGLSEMDRAAKKFKGRKSPK